MKKIIVTLFILFVLSMRHPINHNTKPSSLTGKENIMLKAQDQIQLVIINQKLNIRTGMLKNFTY